LNLDNDSEILFPLFLKLAGRPVLLVGGGVVATSKAHVLAGAAAIVTVVSPKISQELAELAAARGWRVQLRPFEVTDVDHVWLAIAAATAAVNRAVADAAEARRIFVVAVDDPPAASAYGAGIVRRAGVTVAVSTAGQAPALAGLLREGLEALLPEDLDAWLREANRLRPSWRAEGVAMSDRRPRLLMALNQLYGARAATSAAGLAVPGGPGHVTLIGAGPGESDLLTIRGARRLGEADLVLYDALSSEGMRAYAPRARWFYVGKRACRQSIGQDVLNRLMIREARRGRAVVRLKCGDSFVFGRGGEELLALAEAGIACEVVPGVTSAVAGPELEGIPVTHRGTASAFVVMAGHHEAIYRPILAGLPTSGITIVVMMGLGQRAAIATALADFGWDLDTPAAVIVGAASAATWRWTGRLGDLGGVQLPSAPPGEPGAPGLLVIGQVVAVAGQIEQLRSERRRVGESDATGKDTAADNDGQSVDDAVSGRSLSPGWPLGWPLGSR
jgi:uroporphyrin-III C-methyltransferase/precorrin-2 dehydrogenase/sirohydrochlorin ferrochelatase